MDARTRTTVPPVQRLSSTALLLYFHSLSNTHTLSRSLLALPAPPVFDDCENNIPNGYARVSGAIDWIEEQICAYSDYVPKDIKCRKNPKGAKGTKVVKGVKTPKRVRQRLGR